jgi:hypothetical protein
LTKAPPTTYERRTVTPAVRAEILSVRNISMRFGGIVALDDVTQKQLIHPDGQWTTQSMAGTFTGRVRSQDREVCLDWVGRLQMTGPLLLPGIKVNTSPTDHAPIEQEQLAKLDGERWAIFGELVDASKK